MKVAILGLSITSSWGNGHATNYRALARALIERGDEVAFLERDTPWYAANRDLDHLAWVHLYRSLAELRDAFGSIVRDADLVIVGSFVPEGADVAVWVLARAHGPVAFYDIDTPVTLEKFAAGDHEYLSAELVERFDAYLSFTGGRALEILSERYGARRAEPFYCFVDPDAYAPVPAPVSWALNYLGTYDYGRQAAVERLLLDPARLLSERRFALAGPMYPPEIEWPANVERIEHLPPREHPRFYRGAAFTLNLTRPQMRELGYSPSVRLFEAAACAAPIVSDRWPGIEEIFEPGEEVLLADDADEVTRIMVETSAEQRERIAAAARARVLAEHTAARRAQRLHELVGELQREIVR